MRFSPATLGSVALAAAVIMTGCSGPKYPACEKDENCKKNADGTAISEYCVNQQCQECREDSHCDLGKECKTGRCEQKEGWCKADGDCGEGQLCESNFCTDVQCTTDEDCQEGETCDAGRCVPAGCVADQECAAGERCENGECVAGDTDNISADCRPTDGGNDIVAVTTVNFDFNDDALRVDARSALDQNAECLKQAPGVQVVLEGHCDERGTQEYNLALGERRAATVMSYLRNLGIDTNRLRVVSKGKNVPVCNRNTESCWAQNRRVEFIQKRGGGF